MTELALDKTRPAEVVALEAPRDDLISRGMSIAVNDAGSQKIAGAMLLETRSLIKQIETARLALTGPLNDHVRFINSQFKPLSNPLTQLDTHLSGQITAYRRVLEMERLKEQERLRKKEEKRQPASLLPEVIVPLVRKQEKKIETDGGDLSFMSVPKWEIADYDLIPKEYFILNEAIITKLVKGGIPSIPGIRIYKEDVPVNRSR